MATIRRFGPSLVTPQVTPAPQLGRGREKAFATFQQAFQSANDFIRPEVERIQKAKGEEEALAAINDNSFEPAQAFTVRGQAFNQAAERVITAESSALLQDGLRVAQQKADGNVDRLREEMKAVRADVFGSLPKGLPGIASNLQSQFERASVVAERQTIELARRRVMARQAAARNQMIQSARDDAERLALTGALQGEMADSLAQATEMLAQFGPRGAFEIAGQEFPADPSRAGTMTPDDIAGTMAGITSDAQRLMLEAELERSENPSMFAREFKQQVLSGNSPLPPGESLKLARTMESRARTRESQRQTAVTAERKRLESGMDETINAYSSLTEAGVPAVIGEEEQARIRENLAPFPELQREFETEIAVANAAAETFGMSGPELVEFVDDQRASVRAAAERGEIDLAGAAVINSLEDRVKKVQDAVTAETVGLPLIDQLVRDGARVEDVDYDALREQAAGNPETVALVNETEAFHRDAEQLGLMSASQREAVLERGRSLLRRQAAAGQEFGSEAITTGRVLDRLEEFSEHRQGLAKSDPLKFARSAGVEMPSLEGAQDMRQVAEIIVQRVTALAPKAAREGVENVVPVSQAEIEGISEAFQSATRADRAAFVGQVAELGTEQAMAVFGAIGQAEPVLFAAGAVHSMGNKEASSVILRGAGGAKLKVEPDGLTLARTAALGPLLEQDRLSNDDVETADQVAMAYARGKALADGGTEVTQDDLEQGYHVALGRQQDGTGGAHDTAFGPVLLPPNWDASRLEDELAGGGGLGIGFVGTPPMTDEKLTRLAGGQVVDGQGRTMTASEVVSTTESMIAPDQLGPMAFSALQAKFPKQKFDEHVLVPLGPDGGAFLVDTGGGVPMPLFYDLRELE